jgi:hypothetical protein
MIDGSSHADPSGEVPAFAAGSMISPKLQAALKASTEAKCRPVLEGLSKGALGTGLPKAVLGPALKERIDGPFRLLTTDVSKMILEARLPKAAFGDFAKLAPGPVVKGPFHGSAGRTVGDRARFSDLLGQVGELPPLGTDSQATLEELGQVQTERRIAHKADEAILDLRDHFAQLVSIMQAVQQDQEGQARVNRRLQAATLAATILLALISYLLPPRSANAPPNRTVPPSSVTVPPGQGSTTRQISPRPAPPRTSEASEP